MNVLCRFGADVPDATDVKANGRCAAFGGKFDKR
jgi:hypothetical protein